MHIRFVNNTCENYEGTQTLVRLDKRMLPLHVLGGGEGRLSKDHGRKEYRNG